VSGPATYDAVVCESLGAIERLARRSLERAPLQPPSVRIAVKAAGLNFPDLLMIAGSYQHRPALPFVPGLEAAGLISEVAGEVGPFAVGDKVIVQLRSGGYAEEVVASPAQLRPMPPAFSFAEAATFLVAHLTAYHALKTRADLKAGQTLLVLGSAGGVGLASVEIGKLLGARVIAAASSRAKLQAAEKKGADHLIDYARQPIAQALHGLTAGAGADLVFDPVGIAPEAALRCLAWNGKLLVVGFTAGAIPAYAANRILLKGASVLGVRAGEAGRRDPAQRQQELAALQALALQGLVKPLVSAQFPLASFADAMRLLAERQAIGRVALLTEPAPEPAQAGR
jgi:NADPH:quinone reductase